MVASGDDMLFVDSSAVSLEEESSSCSIVIPMPVPTRYYAAHKAKSGIPALETSSSLKDTEFSIFIVSWPTKLNYGIVHEIKSFEIHVCNVFVVCACVCVCGSQEQVQLLNLLYW